MMPSPLNQRIGDTAAVRKPNWLLILLLMAFALPGTVRAVQPDEVGTGQLLFRIGEQWLPSIQLATRAEMTVNGMVARVTIEQRFRNTQPDWAEGSYVFPLPETAAVSELTITVDDRVIVGEIHEKDAAKRVYQQALDTGKRAALLEQNRPNLFRTRVANIGPGQEINVTLTYLEKVSCDNNVFSLRLPMTVTAPYDKNRTGPTPATAAGPSTPVSGQVTDDTLPAYGAAGPVQIVAHVDAGMELARIESPYHPILTEQRDTTYTVALANNVVPMDRDFVLRWEPLPSATPRAALFAETLDGDTYAMLLVVPPRRTADVRRLDRELVFVVDTSGSMGGTPIEAARSAMQKALATLSPTDRFNIITFDDSARKLFPEPRFASGAYLQDAWAYIEGIEADNGTDMVAAIRAALEDQPAPPPGTVRQVVLLTDGGVWASDELFRLIDEKRGESRLFTVGIGSAPNSYFMRKAAQFGGGSYTYIANDTEAGSVMQALFDRLSAPQLSGLSVGWSDNAESFPAHIPDLYAGEPLLVTARINGTDRPLIAGIRDRNGQWQQNLRVTEPGANVGVATLWARDKVEALYDRITEEGDSAALRRNIVELGLRHRLVTRYTSFVAVEQTPVRPTGERVNRRRVPNAAPAGSALVLPQTNAGTYSLLLTGLASLILAGVITLRARRIVANRAKVSLPC